MYTIENPCPCWTRHNQYNIAGTGVYVSPSNDTVSGSYTKIGNFYGITVTRNFVLVIVPVKLIPQKFFVNDKHGQKATMSVHFDRRPLRTYNFFLGFEPNVGSKIRK